ncbi:MAG: ribonuclease R [Simkaniaceae bacterium]|nr:ribonuclease R [Simkaniaceae bacterium]
MEGVIHVHPRGFGFVTPSSDTKGKGRRTQDIFIPKSYIKNAMDGDVVKVAIAPEGSGDKGPEGRILAIIETNKKNLVGVVRFCGKSYYIAYVPALGEERPAYVKPRAKEKYVVGERLLVQIIDRGDEEEPIICRAIESIGLIDDPSTDIPAVLKEFDISPDFPEEVLREVGRLPKKVLKKEMKGRSDLTELETFTIDPDTARDFDDALSLTKDEKGYRLAVHIADVSHYVRIGSALDEEAARRCNSTYFPGLCIPMIPEALADNLCSLREGEIRLTVSVLTRYDLKGKCLSSSIERSYIRSRKRFTYEEAKQVLDRKRKSVHYSTLKLMEKLCLLMKKERMARGSIDLALPETVIRVDEKGKPTGYEVVDYDITHRIVEEFMLKANEIVASHLVDSASASMFRVHDNPDKETLETFYALCRTLGFSLPADPSCTDLQKVFTEAKKTPYLQTLSIAFIKSMKLASYSEWNTGHFGLALDNYCHFTSPIRRYGDLVLHRLLFAEEEVAEEKLRMIAENCSQKERVSFRAESNILIIKKLRLLADFLESDPKKIYEGIVTKVKPFGIFFEIICLQIGGMIHISELSDDYYTFLQDKGMLVSETGEYTFKTGDTVRVMLRSVDPATSESTWTLCLKGRGKRRRGSKGRRGGRFF